MKKRVFVYSHNLNQLIEVDENLFKKMQDQKPVRLAGHYDFDLNSFVELEEDSRTLGDKSFYVSASAVASFDYFIQGFKGSKQPPIQEIPREQMFAVWYKTDVAKMVESIHKTKHSAELRLVDLENLPEYVIEPIEVFDD